MFVLILTGESTQHTTNFIIRKSAYLAFIRCLPDNLFNIYLSFVRVYICRLSDCISAAITFYSLFGCLFIACLVFIGVYPAFIQKLTLVPKKPCRSVGRSVGWSWSVRPSGPEKNLINNANSCRIFIRMGQAYTDIFISKAIKILQCFSM